MEGYLTRRLENDEYLLDMLGCVNDILNMADRKDFLSRQLYQKLDNLFDLLNTYWHGRDG